jgi:hypothetical protein
MYLSPQRRSCLCWLRNAVDLTFASHVTRFHLSHLLNLLCTHSLPYRVSQVTSLPTISRNFTVNAQLLVGWSEIWEPRVRFGQGHRLLCE